MPAPVPRPPVVTPGYYPGTPAAPVHTPAGAGLPGERVPGQVQPVPRSPNKRTLPPTEEPGFWAADGAPTAALTEPKIYGITIPFPPLATPADKALVNLCAEQVNEVSETGKVAEFVTTNYPEDVRRCLALSAFSHCATNMRAGLEMAKGYGWLKGMQGVRLAKRMANHAKRIADLGCKDVVLSDEQKKVSVRVAGMWDDKARNMRYQRD
jgi:hypothetical protein